MNMRSVEICDTYFHLKFLIDYYYASNKLVSAFDTTTQSKHYVVLHRYYANRRCEQKRNALSVFCVVNFSVENLKSAGVQKNCCFLLVKINKFWCWLSVLKVILCMFEWHWKHSELICVNFDPKNRLINLNGSLLPGNKALTPKFIEVHSWAGINTP